MKLFRLIAAGLLLGPVAAAQAADAPPAQSPRSEVAEPGAAEPRFDGYLYLDVKGRPLPIQADTDIEAFLVSAEIVESSPLGTGITLPRTLILQGDGFRVQAIFKDVDIERRKVTEIINGRNRFSLDWRDWHGFDVAAYVLDRLLGLDRVPPAVPRSVGRHSGTVRIWLEGTVSELERSGELHVEPPDMRRWNQQRSMMQVFDNLVANRDSNLGNLLIDGNWRLWFIDCTRCFGKTTTMYYPLDNISHCERGFWRGLNDLEAAKTREALSPYLDKGEIKALLARRDTIVRHFRKLIDERGEAGVLYEVDSPTVKASWGND